MSLNGDFETYFDVDEASKTTLRIYNNGVTNREKITAQDLSGISFSAKLTHVQYGTYNGADAVLLRFYMGFQFRHNSRKRITFAMMRFMLEETQDSSFTPHSPRNPLNDPVIRVLSPVQVTGEITTESVNRKWSLSVPIQYQSFGMTAGPEFGFETEAAFVQEHRMWILGGTTSTDDHHEDNIARWEMSENKSQESGILHRLPVAIVATLPSDPPLPVKVTGTVETSVAFSLNPVRLKQKRDDPIFLDRKTGKGSPVAPGLDFGSQDFPWHEVVQLSCELEDKLHAHS